MGRRLATSARGRCGDRRWRRLTSTTAPIHASHLGLMRAAARSAIAITVALGFIEVIEGITEASATRRPSTPWTRSRGSTTARPSTPIRQVPTGWNWLPAAWRAIARHSAVLFSSAAGVASVGFHRENGRGDQPSPWVRAKWFMA